MECDNVEEDMATFNQNNPGNLSDVEANGQRKGNIPENNAEAQENYIDLTGDDDSDSGTGSQECFQGFPHFEQLEQAHQVLELQPGQGFEANPRLDQFLQSELEPFQEYQQNELARNFDLPPQMQEPRHNNKDSRALPSWYFWQVHPFRPNQGHPGYQPARQIRSPLQLYQPRLFSPDQHTNFPQPTSPSQGFQQQPDFHRGRDPEQLHFRQPHQYPQLCPHPQQQHAQGPRVSEARQILRSTVDEKLLLLRQLYHKAHREHDIQAAEELRKRMNWAIQDREVEDGDIARML